MFFGLFRRKPKRPPVIQLYRAAETSAKKSPKKAAVAVKKVKPPKKIRPPRDARLVKSVDAFLTTRGYPSLRTLCVVFAASGAATGLLMPEAMSRFSAKGRAITALMDAAKNCPDSDSYAYRARLESHLRFSTGDAAVMLHKLGVTPCLRTDFMKTQVLMAVFYPKNRVLFLRDDGVIQTKSKILTEPFHIGQVFEAVNTLPDALILMRSMPEVMYAGMYGKNKPQVEWWWDATKAVPIAQPRTQERPRASADTDPFKLQDRVRPPVVLPPSGVTPYKSQDRLPVPQAFAP